ncbi:UNVERIFIED_CONTAM: hypothetical protein RKD43_001187 [Streptomyces graminofaciens]
MPAARSGAMAPPARPGTGVPPSRPSTGAAPDRPVSPPPASPAQATPPPAAAPARPVPPPRPAAAPPSRPATGADRPAPPGAVPPPRPGRPDEPGDGSIPEVETTTRLRPVTDGPGPAAPARPARPPRPIGSVDMTPRPDAPRPPAQLWIPPETPAEMTTRLRPVRTRHPARTVGAVAAVVLGLGLIGGAVTGTWLTGDSSADTAEGNVYAEVRTAWHSVPVDTLFPRTLDGDGAGPGGADRVWTRIAVAPDSDCATALDPLLTKALEPVGCARVLRATYTDATASSVTTVGMVFTEADEKGMLALHNRFTTESLGERTDLMPRTFPAKGTVSAGFGDEQRASWTVEVVTEAPVVVYAVSGFADGRAVADPQPADEAQAEGATNAPAQAGLGHEATGLAERIEKGLRGAVGEKGTEESR